jgi:HK97 family phage major capsid protein
MEPINGEALVASLTKRLDEIAEGTVTKAQLKKLEDEMTAFRKAHEDFQLRTKSDPIFGTRKEAMEFVDVLRGAIAKSDMAPRLQKDSPFHVTKADLNSYGTGTGVETVPTATADVLSLLLLQSSLPREEFTVIDGVQGNLVLPKRNGTGSVKFTAGGGALKDDVAITAGSFGTASVTLSPKQLAGLSLVSEKLLYASAIAVAQYVAVDLAEQAGYRENYVCYKGDGTADEDNGSITGLKSAAGIDATVSPTVAQFAAAPIDYLIDLTTKVHQSVYADPQAKFFFAPAVDALIRKSKASTAGSYHFDPATGSYKLAGREVKIWHIMDNASAATNVPAIFGNPRKAAILGLGRDMGVEVSKHYVFNKVQDAFRLVYDADMQVVQAGALARILMQA